MGAVEVNTVLSSAVYEAAQVSPVRPGAAQPDPDTTIRRIMVLGICVAIGMLAVGVALLLDARQDAWSQAERSSANLASTLERDITRNFAVFDLSLQGAIDALDQPGIKDVSPGLRQAAIFDRAASAEYLGSLLVLDASGNVTFDSTSVEPHRLNLADRDYFKAHKHDPSAGLFLSDPFRSRLRNDDASIAISRRLSGPNGEFEGVVVGTLRLAYFSDMFRSLDLGPGGAVMLIRDDGYMVARYPLFQETFNQDYSRAPAGDAVISGGTGQIIARSAADGVERLLEYRRIRGLPLHIAVGMSVHDILAPWWRKAAVVGGILALLAAAAVTLLLLFRREMARRLMAEASLRDAAHRLEAAAKTDALTGLPNRRAFGEAMDLAWVAACRSGGTLSMLMIDADGFKLFNDRYGHQEGDRALTAVGQAIRANLRRGGGAGPGDFGARYGGEEFAVLLPNTELGAAVAVAERIRTEVRSIAIPHADGPGGFVTVSIGVSTASPQSGDRDRILVRTADAALYDAKHAGRNRVCVNTAGLSSPSMAPAALWMPKRRDSQVA